MAKEWINKYVIPEKRKKPKPALCSYCRKLVSNYVFAKTARGFNKYKLKSLQKKFVKHCGEVHYE